MASGALEHFGAVIHTPSPAPQVAGPARVAIEASVAPAPLLLSPHYSTPKHSQAPPAA
jgi:hypothetical protein